MDIVTTLREISQFSCLNKAEKDSLKLIAKDVKQLKAELAKYKAGNVPVSQIIADNEAMAIKNEQLQAKNEKLEFLCGFAVVDDCGCENCTIDRMYHRLRELQDDYDRLAEEAEGLRDDLCYIASTWTGPPSDYAYDAVKAVKEKDESKKGKR